MALQSQVWSPATPMPMAESSLYRQRLEVIAEKRRLQEEIRSARRELEEEKLRVERLKRKSLRERWLMDGAAEGPERPEDPTSPDPQSPEGQAQAHIQHLEDSLFTLQSQLQLLQSASTGAQHKPSGRPTWRRQGHRPLSQPPVKASPAGCTDLDKRASLPAGLPGTAPESPLEPGDEAVRAAPALRPLPGAAAASSEANGPCSGPSPAPEQEASQGQGVSQGRAGQAKGGGVVEVVWEGLRATEDSATGPELEAKVEVMVLEAIADRQEASCPERPSWAKEDRGVVEVVWEGVGGTEGSESEATGVVGRGPESARLQEGGEGVASEEEGGAPLGSPDSDGQGGCGAEEASFIWVERVTLSEEWEELVVERREGGAEGPPGVEGGRGEDTWKAEASQAEGSVGASERKAGAEQERAETSPVGERKGRWESLELEGRGGEEEPGADREGGEEPLSAERKEAEGPLRAERGRGEEPSGGEQKGGEGELEAGEEVKEPLAVERQGSEGSLGAEKERGEEKLGAEEEAEGPLGAEKERGEEKLGAEEEAEGPLGAERKGAGETRGAAGGPLGTERRGSEGSRKEEEPLEAEKAPGVEEGLSLEEQREPGAGGEGQVEEAGAPPAAEEDGPQPPEKQEGSLEEETARPQTPAEGRGPSGDATLLLAETPAPEQPAECQPLLQAEGPTARPAPARTPGPPAPLEAEEASGPKQKTCQCCAVM
ncbi:paralemmin-3 isoform X1 [Equus asinus]|uniref:paralemmin-3 isoform X1 n=2 Tax=Equus asinus TaxID=9793 RepID=UPI001D059995|nr:paralemmin-3 isoform X1 [Equus asinus]